MEKRMALMLVGIMVLAVIAASACVGGAAPAASPGAAATAAPTIQAAATKAGATVQAAGTQAAATGTAQATSTAAAATKPAASPSATTGAGGNVSAGQTVYQQNCNSCHPNGQAGVGPALAGKNLSADRIKAQVRNGGGGMPAFSSSQISDQQLNDLVAYVQSLK